MRVQHRHVIYVQGYDPRGLAQYYRMFRTELRKFGRLYDLTTAVGRPKDNSAGEFAHESSSWTIEASGDGWQTRTDYDFLRWEDLIQRDLAAPIWRTLVHGMLIYWGLVFSGTMGRFWRAHWRFATFISWPHFVLLNEAIWSAAAAWLVAWGLQALGVHGFFVGCAATAVFVAVLGSLVKYTEERTYLLYLMADTIFTWQFSHGNRPEWDARIDRFAQHLVNVAQNSDAQEIILVGHSSGSFLGSEILARALELDPDLGRRGSRVVLLTLGGNMPIVGFHRGARAFRNNLRRLATEPSIDWIDCQSRKDVMNFYPFDPIAGHGIDVGSERRNPTIIPVRFREIIKAEHYNQFRWKFFRVHFQFVMANERPHPYDFFMIVCGPVPLRDRLARPAATLDIFNKDAAIRENAWKTLHLDQIGAVSAPSDQVPSAVRLSG